MIATKSFTRSLAGLAFAMGVAGCSAQSTASAPAEDSMVEDGAGEDRATDVAGIVPAAEATPRPVPPRVPSKARVPFDDASRAAPGADHATLGASLARDMVGNASIDGAPVTAFRMDGRCASVVGTGGGDVRFDWSKSGEVNAYGEGGREVFPLPDATGRRRLVAAPSGDKADGIMMSVGVLAGDCSGEGDR